MMNLSVGAIHLHVKDIELMHNFYEHSIGLDMKNGPLMLHHTPSLPPAAAASAGLYHMALLFSSRGTLARTLSRILQSSPHLFSGAADHLVSEAFYLSDPEGNGIELYVDRDRSTWHWKNGQIQMASQYIDPITFIHTHQDEESASSIQMGHIHLKVGDLTLAERFYADTLGFDITARLPGALFVAAGGYHHHIGMNTWESANAGKRKETLGLNKFELVLSDPKEFFTLQEKLDENTIIYSNKKTILTLYDPWNTMIEIRR